MSKPAKPVLLLGDEVKEMNTSARVAIAVLRFIDERKNLDVGKYLQRHIEIIALAFDTTPAEVEEKVQLATVISKYFDCLKYTVGAICKVADESENKMAAGV